MGRKLALVLEYDGAAYHGFQVQPGAPTVQGKLQEALAFLTGERVRMVGAGRTDAGAHALGQVVSFGTESALPSDTVVSGLNAYLPQDIAVQACREVGQEFDARRSAGGRWYRYTLLRRRVRSAVLRTWSYRTGMPLDLTTMAAAGQALVGHHDFASFTTPEYASGTVRQGLRAEITEDGGLVYIDLEATAFLPQQVRRTVAALLQVGTGRKTVADFRELLQRPYLGAAGSGVPACGLCLMAVRYPPPYDSLRPAGVHPIWSLTSRVS